MKENKRLVITIGRQYGSGGREIGARLAKDLGLGFYDKNILRLNSDESGIKESFYHMADEKAGNKLLYRIVKSLAPELGTPSLGTGSDCGGQSVPLPVRGDPQAGGRGGLCDHRPLCGLCAGRL